jgi:hypothetical protein
MAYSTTADIQQEFPTLTFTDDDTSKVKLASIPDFIADADALIDSYLGARYVVPVDGGDASLAVLKFYSRSLVADKIKGILEIRRETSDRAQQNPRTGLSTKDIIRILEGYRDGTSVLPDAEGVDDSFSAGAFAYGGTGIQTQRFSKDVDNW